LWGGGGGGAGEGGRAIFWDEAEGQAPVRAAGRCPVGSHSSQRPVASRGPDGDRAEVLLNGRAVQRRSGPDRAGEGHALLLPVKKK